MKKSIVILILLTLLTSCSKEENLDSTNELSKKLTLFEKTLNNERLYISKTSFTIDEVKSDFNDYDSDGYILYNAINSFSDYIIDYKNNHPNYAIEDLNPYITNEISNLGYNQSIQFNENEQLLFDSFIKDLLFENAIERIKDYEQFVANNFSNQADVKNFLITISKIKFTAHTFRKRPLSDRISDWEICVTDCMRAKFSSYNVVDWIGFVATNPGANVLWQFGSCSWTCS
jgi:hypothetical protein